MPAGPPTRPGPPTPPDLAPPPASEAGQPAATPGRATRTLVATADNTVGHLVPIHDPVTTSIDRLRARLDAVRADLQLRALRAVPVARLAELTDDSIRLGTLESAGVTTVADVVARADLTVIHGIGAKTATTLAGAAEQMANLVMDTVVLRLDPDERPASHGALLAQVARHIHLIELAPQVLTAARATADELAMVMAAAVPATATIMARLFRRRDPAVTRAVARIEQLLSHVETMALVERVRDLDRIPVPSHDESEELWRWFMADSATIHATLESVLGVELGADSAAPHGSLPDEIVEAVRAQSLDTTLLNLSLRGYQSFGARYALVQDRVLIGDEMGLGKTITALAVAAHLWARDARRVLVVCPASVLLNWQREVDVHTFMTAVHLHGDGRDDAIRAWARDGGIGVTTFGTLRTLPGPETTDLLIVDEAHYVKNPATLRARSLAPWADMAGRVVYLTGTPLENRVDEFRELVGQLRPDIAEPLENHFALAGTQAFRSWVAPVYLRRNQEDVLAELPPRLEVQDWVEPTPQDEQAYREAVISGNFMAMRRAAWAHASAGQSAKLRRLLEIVEESAVQGWKVVVFSFFLDVLDVAVNAIGAARGEVVVFGPLTGTTSPAGRLELVDQFQAHVGPAVLVAQVQAGGVGLNMQAASVVVLTEPQWKPSTEEQAIARCHRMGQVRRVNVHRLLATPGVDAAMVELVAAKAALFDEVARPSAIVDAAPDARDRSETAMIRDIITSEARRLGLGAPTGVSPRDGPIKPGVC